MEQDVTKPHLTLVMGPDGAMRILKANVKAPDGVFVNIVVRRRHYQVILPDGSLQAFIAGKVESWLTARSMMAEAANARRNVNPYQLTIFPPDTKKTIRDGG